MPEPIETDFIALRKIPYTDNAVILSGIAPEHGRLGFIVRGASSRRDFPLLDIFRLLHVQFVPGRESLGTLRTADLVEDFSRLAGDYDAYRAASWIAAFSLLNVMPMLPHPLYANAVEVALRRLANGTHAPDAVRTCVAVAFLFEEGWLAHAIRTERASEQCRQLLEMAAGRPGPDLTPESWKRQLDWSLGLLLANDCRLPETT